MKRAAVLLAVLAMVATLAPAGAAQLACGPLAVLLKELAERYHEFPVMTGTNKDGARVAVTLSDAGTFTVLLGDGKGACVILAGTKAELNNGI